MLRRSKHKEKNKTRNTITSVERKRKEIEAFRNEEKKKKIPTTDREGGIIRSNKRAGWV
jgi:hypothetical protein